MRDLIADKDVCDKATPGPWVMVEESEGSRFYSVIHGTAGVSFSGNRDDNKFIAAAREGWPEAIERAIAAEEEFKNEKKYCIEMSTEYLKIINKNNEKLHETENQLSALREASDLQRHSIQQLSAQLVGLRGALDLIRIHFAENICHSLTCPFDYCQGEKCKSYEARKVIANTLNSTDPGAEIRERIEKLEAVAESLLNYRKFASVYCDHQENIAWHKVEKALAALEGGERP